MVKFVFLNGWVRRFNWLLVLMRSVILVKRLFSVVLIVCVVLFSLLVVCFRVLYVWL